MVVPAVSNLLCGAPIDGYLVQGFDDCLDFLNTAIGNNFTNQSQAASSCGSSSASLYYETYIQVADDNPTFYTTEAFAFGVTTQQYSFAARPIEAGFYWYAAGSALPSNYPIIGTTNIVLDAVGTGLPSSTNDQSISLFRYAGTFGGTNLAPYSVAWTSTLSIADYPIPDCPTTNLNAIAKGFQENAPLFILNPLTTSNGFRYR